MRCAKHPMEAHFRAVPELTRAGRPGDWQCGACHPPPAVLEEKGNVEFYGRPPRPYVPIGPNSPARILRSIGAERTRRPASILGRAMAPAPSEAKGPPTTEQAAPGPVGRDPVKMRPVRAEAPAPAKKEFVDASSVDLDAAVAAQVAAAEGPPPGSKGKRKPAARRAPEPPGDALF